jgi:hypothetical protein
MAEEPANRVLNNDEQDVQLVRLSTRLFQLQVTVLSANTAITFTVPWSAKASCVPGAPARP